MANDDEINSKQTEPAQLLHSEINQKTRIQNPRRNLPTNTNSSVETEATVVNQSMVRFLDHSI